ncbi:fatty acyl-CoA reductase wat-like isoform X2 [Euwallacea similis]|uniref:fatty acyl-CoA reductase wat-like isoform X2 n=1 Tax=Euwallacea similis TaxID=1736056 RepID=UPI00344EE1AA
MVLEDCGRTTLLSNNNNENYFSINKLYNINDISTPAIYENEVDLTPVQEFYNEGKVFITGSTGFLGTHLYFLSPLESDLTQSLRSKRGKDLKERVDEMFDDEIFDMMKKAYPKFRHKIVAIAGDCTMPGLGLSIEDRKRLIDEVNIVFHVAATVRFDEKLANAVAINVRAPRDMLRLAKEMCNLKVLMHVSTIYANCLNHCIEEKVYEPAIEPEKLILLAENVPADVLDDMTPKLLGKYPNTYTYTKQVAETVVAREFQNMPVAIFRPAIVIPTYKEPVSGWINNLYGPTGIAVGAGIGLLRTLHCDAKVNANLVPVDMCVNSLIVIAPKIAESFRSKMKTDRSFKIRVFNYGSTNESLLTWGAVMDYLKYYGLMTPPLKAMWYLVFDIYKYYPVYLLMTVLLHTLPAILMDSVLLCTGQKPKMMAIYKKIHKFSNVISYFSTHDWQIRTDNVLWVQNRLQEMDQKLFLSDLRKIDWKEYYEFYVKGVRVYLLKDPLDTIDKAKVRWKKLYYAHQTIKVLSYMALLWLSFWLIKILF